MDVETLLRFPSKGDLKVFPVFPVFPEVQITPKWQSPKQEGLSNTVQAFIYSLADDDLTAPPGDAGGLWFLKLKTRVCPAWAC